MITGGRLETTHPLMRESVGSLELEAGDRLGRYRIEELAGVGGMGRVYRARDLELGREVAVKLVLRGDRGQVGSARLRREARAMARLNHPNVLPVYEVADDPAGTYIVMEFVRGQTLAKWSASPRPWREVLRVHLQAARGIAAAHAEGLVHRDYKPQNVLIGDDGRVRVMDFGLAREATVEEVTLRPGDVAPPPMSDVLTGQGLVVGTVLYMAPEQHEGQPPNPRSDQYAYCLTLWEGLYGQRPFQAKGIERAKRRGPPAVPDVGRRVPDAMGHVLRRGLEPYASDRWASMSALIAALEAAAQGSRRWVAAAVSAAGVSVAALALFWPRAEIPCSAEDASRRLGWHEGPRTDVQTAMRRDGWDPELVVGGVDDYAGRWVHAWTEQCRAHSSKGTRLLDARHMCLADLRRDFSAAIEVLGESSGAQFARAPELVGRLEPPESCGRIGEGRPATLQDNVENDPVREQLAIGRALVQAGRPSDALVRVDDALVGARRLEDAHLVGDAILLRCRARHALDRFGDARVDCQHAFASAVRAGDYDAAVEAAHLLASLHGTDLLEFETAEQWLRQAQSLVDRTADVAGARVDALVATADLRIAQHRDAEAAAALEQAIADEVSSKPWRAALLYEKLAHAQAGLGRLGDVDANLERAAEIARRELGPVHPTVASIENARAVSAVRRGDLAMAAQRYEAALAVYEDLGDEGLRFAQTSFNLGQLLGRRGDVEGSRARFERALAVMSSHLGADHPRLAPVFGALGTNAIERADWNEAERRLVRAIELVREAVGEGDPQFALYLAELGRVRIGQGRLDDAESLLREAIETQVRNEGGQSANLAWFLNNLASVHARRGEEARARKTLRRSLEIFDVAGDRLGSAEARFMLAQSLARSATHPTRAMELATRAMDDYAAMGPGFEPDVAKISEWIAARIKPSGPNHDDPRTEHPRRRGP